MKISFMHFMKWTSKSNATSSFSGILNGLYFLLLFYFHYHCQLVKVQLQQKSGRGGGREAAAPPLGPCATISTYTYSAQWKGLHA